MEMMRRIPTTTPTDIEPIVSGVISVIAHVLFSSGMIITLAFSAFGLKPMLKFNVGWCLGEGLPLILKPLFSFWKNVFDKSNDGLLLGIDVEVVVVVVSVVVVIVVVVIGFLNQEKVAASTIQISKSFK